MAQEETKTDYMTIICMLIGFVMLIYIGLLALFMFYPPAFKSLIADPMFLYEKFRKEEVLYSDPYRDILWATNPDKPKGVTVNTEAAYQGATLFESTHFKGAQLIDMAGNVIHSWKLPYEKACVEEAENGIPEHMYFWGRAHLSKEGQLFGIYDCYTSSHLVKLDHDGTELWRYSDHPHHDVEETEDGFVYTFSTHSNMDPNPAMPQITEPYMDEFVVKLDANGQEVQRISIFKAFEGSPAEHMLTQMIHDPTGGRLNAGDMLHPNSIEIIPEALEELYPFYKQGHLMLSFRNNGLLAILDPESEKITYAAYGPWRAQHDPRFWEDGSVIMYDNEGWLGEGGASRVIQFDPQSMFIFWQYTGTEQKPLYSAFNSSVDPLPNGNILITESAGGRLLEVNQAGEIVWEFYNPYREMYEGAEMMPSVFRGRRYSGDKLSFVGARQ